MQLIFEKSKPPLVGVRPPQNDTGVEKKLDAKYLRKDKALLPSVSEPDVIRHFTNLSKMNFGVDSHFYPLGSCTMKYNPKFTETIAGFHGFTSVHPMLPQIDNKGAELAQGALEVIYELEKALCEITGMDEFTTQPMAGAHGELTGIMIIAAYHKQKGNRKKYILIPDSGHGTNPASAAVAGYEVKSVPTDKNGVMDLEAFKGVLTGEVAAVMLTCPNTLGLFNPHIKEICDLTHKAGGLVYYDGANLNAIMGKARPGDLGFDVIHLNLHKTFATPHGGGGPGAGPVGVRRDLVKYLPLPRVEKNGEKYSLNFNLPHSIGEMSSFYGNFLVLLKAYAYIVFLGKEGLLEASENAVLNANYIKAKLKDYYDVPYDNGCMHEFVLSASRQLEKGVRALDIAKALIDKGIHPPTIYFPLIVKEAMMIEPTETESKETLDKFIEIMIELARLAETNPEAFKEFPKTTPVGRLDEVKAAKDLDLCSLK